MVLRAHVRNGRIVVDEPTDLPEGTELALVKLEEADDDLDDEDLERLRAAIREGLTQGRSGAALTRSDLERRLHATPR